MRPVLLTKGRMPDGGRVPTGRRPSMSRSTPSRICVLNFPLLSRSRARRTHLSCPDMGKLPQQRFTWRKSCRMGDRSVQMSHHASIVRKLAMGSPSAGRSKGRNGQIRRVISLGRGGMGIATGGPRNAWNNSLPPPHPASRESETRT